MPYAKWLGAREMFFILATVLLSIFFLYAYLVNKTIMNAVAREETNEKIAELSSTIGNLEFSYMSEKSGITLEVAHARGFRDATPTQFISRVGGSVVTYNSVR